MIGIVVQLLLSWLLLWWFDKSSLSVLGFTPSRKRLFDFALFFIISAFLSASTFLLRMWIAKQEYQLNPVLNWISIGEGVWYNIKSVLYEELIFRGALLYLLVKKLGPLKALIFSSSAFGAYHWFTHNTLGNPTGMFIDFVVTGTMGLLLAYGYVKSNSMYLPIAIHFGWNLVQQVVFSGGHLGKQLFIEVLPAPVVTVSYFAYFFMQLFPLVSVLVVCFLLIRSRYQSLHN
jgi:membrane protease YdiL (CAAX protease family)